MRIPNRGANGLCIAGRRFGDGDGDVNPPLAGLRPRNAPGGRTGPRQRNRTREGSQSGGTMFGLIMTVGFTILLVYVLFRASSVPWFWKKAVEAWRDLACGSALAVAVIAAGQEKCTDAALATTSSKSLEGESCRIWDGDQRAEDHPSTGPWPDRLRLTQARRRALRRTPAWRVIPGYGRARLDAL